MAVKWAGKSTTTYHLVSQKIYDWHLCYIHPVTSLYYFCLHTETVDVLNVVDNDFSRFFSLFTVLKL